MAHHLTWMAGEELQAWNARWHRRRRTVDGRHDRDLSWAVSATTTAGSALFVAGGVTSFGRAAVAGCLNLAGSVCFTVASVLFVIEARRAGVELVSSGWARGVWSTIGGRAALIQLVSAAVFFQLAMIVGAARPDLAAPASDLLVWTPSSIGSIGFVVSGELLRREARPADDLGSRAALLNLVGSVCFLTGSVAGYFAQSPWRIPLDVFATPVYLIGSSLFLTGGIVSIVELERPLRPGETSMPPVQAAMA